jgi:hypothetical protein
VVATDIRKSLQAIWTGGSSPAVRIARGSPYDWASLALFAALVGIALWTYDAYAVSNDEPVQQHYGELIIAYYRSGFTDRAVFHYVNLYLYGGLFDVIATLFERVFSFADPYDVRHILCALTGIAGIGAAWATARLVAGPRAGAIAAFALALSGAWYGAMFNHTKDIPFAAAMMGAAYVLLCASRDFPRPRLRHVIGFGVLLGAALGIRVLGLLMVGYAGLAILTHMPRLQTEPMRDRLTFFAHSVIALLPAFLLAYLIMIAAWPWAALSPLNPVRGLIDFGEFHYHIQTLLAGRVYEMANVPRWYVPVYLLIKLPLIVLTGTALALVAVLLRPEAAPARPWWRVETGLLVFFALFPVACEVVDRGPAFTGLRHFLFVVPVLAALAGIGFDRLFDWLAATRWRWLAGVAGATLAARLVWNLALLIELHPYQYLYYNSLVGGLAGASGRYVTDYWVNIMPEATDDLEGYVEALDRVGAGQTKYLVAVCGERGAFEDAANPRLKWTDEWKTADFFIAPTHMNCDKALDGKVIATISRMGVTIGVVKDRRALLHKAVAGRK